MNTLYNIRIKMLFLFVFVGMVGFIILYVRSHRGMSEEEASEAFKRYVLNPIPKSVTNIRADQPKKFRGYRYIFRFNINRDDLGLLINSGPFVKVWNVKYEDGDIWWGWDREDQFGMSEYTSIAICYQSKREPDWFRPQLWDEPEAYAFRKEGDLLNIETFGKKSSGPTNIQILLYNENEAEAYFIVTYWEK